MIPEALKRAVTEAEEFDNMLKEEVGEVDENSNVTHPRHYNRDGAMECIDEMVLLFGKEAVKNFCLCNVWKYRYRAADKNGLEDLEKSDWYLAKYKELDDKDTYKKNALRALETVSYQD